MVFFFFFFLFNRQKYQSRSFSIGTSRSAERLLDVLRDHVTIQRNSSGKDALGGAYDQMQVSFLPQQFLIVSEILRSEARK